MKAFLPILAIALGAIVTPASQYSEAIRVLLIVMLLNAFIGIEFKSIYKQIHMRSGLVVFANIGLGFIWYILIAPFDESLAEIVFLTAISPTAIAAPAMASFWGGNVEFVTASVILTNGAIAFSLPFLSQFLFQIDSEISTLNILQSVAILILTPLGISRLFNHNKYREKYQEILPKVSLASWAIVLFLASAKASHFIRYETQESWTVLVAIAILSALVCSSSFYLGRYLGGAQLDRESSQSLGHKNTMFTVWFALSFLKPTLALGPMFYIIFQNLYNAYQISQVRHFTGSSSSQAPSHSSHRIK
ncbi:bile acid:sodium symporter family protein [Baaleninema simplex]|uniref:bile acid:sodium symporter family protein n=1 Tax=Baaleninema simplex TaxID=2862350 RepID=UPI000349963E|nr:hypothetical protein [Baaleninema simplex]